MSDSEQCSKWLKLDIISLLGQLFMLIEANSDTITVGPSNKDHPFVQMKVLL